MSRWIRYRYQATSCFGLIDDDAIVPYSGDMFAQPVVDKTQAAIKLVDMEARNIQLLPPSTPTKMLALWNNYRALADDKELQYPQSPLYLLKPASSYLTGGQAIRHPPSYRGRVYYEGELGIVIGRQASQLADDAAVEDYVWGYTCVNDVTAFDLLNDYAGFDQWTRAKGFDTFGVFGPCVATDIEPLALTVITRVNGEEVQSYPTADMIIPPLEIVRQLSRDSSLLPGDVICCGTSVGLGPMPRDSLVEVEIPGIGILRNVYQ